jgi:hypothetical protein
MCEPAALDSAAAVPDDFVAELVPETRDVVDEEDEEDVVLRDPLVPLLQEATAGNVTPEGVQISCANC